MWECVIVRMLGRVCVCVGDREWLSVCMFLKFFLVSVAHDSAWYKIRAQQLLLL